MCKIVQKKFFLIVIVLLILTIVRASYLFVDKKEQKALLKEALMVEVAELQGNKMSFKELSNYFSALAEDKGGVYAFNVLHDADMSIGTDLHLLAHVVGDVLYRQQGTAGMRHCTNDFRNACSHSIVVGTLLEKGISALRDIVHACKDAPGGKGAYTMCFHGLGHGVLAYTNYNMERAVELCSMLGTEEYNEREFFECVGGMTMEMLAGVHNPEQWAREKEKYFREDDPLYPCTAEFIPAKAKAMCYTYITPRLLEAAGGSLGNPLPEHFKKAFVYCGKIINTRDRKTCYGGFGKEFIVFAKGRDIRAIEALNNEQLSNVYAWCQLADMLEGRRACIESAVGSLYWGGENEPDVVVRFCSVQKTEEEMYLCYKSLYRNVRSYVEDSAYRIRLCEIHPEKFHTLCFRELLEPV